MLNTSQTTSSAADNFPVVLDMPAEDLNLNLKYPLVCVTPFGTISIIMAHNVNIELSVDKSIRVVCWNKFAISSIQNGMKSAILHPFGHILQEEDKVFCYFYPDNSYWVNSSSSPSPTSNGLTTPKAAVKPQPLWMPFIGKSVNQQSPAGKTIGSTNEEQQQQTNLAKMAILGTQGVLFSMSHLKDAFLVSAAASRGTSALSMERIQFPALRHDYTIRQFYSDSQFGAHQVFACNNIVQRAKYEEKEGLLFTLSINGFLIRQKPNGDVEIYCRPRQILCSPATSTVHVRSVNVEMEVQAEEKAYVKCGVKRVHVSRSGMVVSDGNCTTSMDNIGRIVSAA